MCREHVLSECVSGVWTCLSLVLITLTHCHVIWCDIYIKCNDFRKEGNMVGQVWIQLNQPKKEIQVQFQCVVLRIGCVLLRTTGDWNCCLDSTSTIWTFDWVSGTCSYTFRFEQLLNCNLSVQVNFENVWKWAMRICRKRVTNKDVEQDENESRTQRFGNEDTRSAWRHTDREWYAQT